MSPNGVERICLVVNPRAGGGDTSRRVAELERAAAARFSEVAVRLTERPGHASALAAEAADEGFHVVAAVGGDGTANEVVNGLFDGDRVRRDDVVFTVIPSGTGSDLVKSLRIPSRIPDALAVAARGETRDTDVVRVSYDGDGAGERICINVAGFGMNGEVVRRANRSGKRLGGTVTFLDATVRAMASYRAPDLDLTWTDADGETHAWSGEVLSVFAANGHYCGGGMWVGRGGSMHDGLIDVTVVPSLSLPRTLFGAPRLFTGTMDRVPGVVRVRARELHARATRGGPVLLDVDGEQPGALPVSLRVLPGALRVRGRW